MFASDECIELIKRFEAFAPHPYYCPAGKLTWGYGHAQRKGERVPVNPLTQEVAVRLLVHDLKQFEHAVFDAVKVPVTQAQFDALVSLAFNIGAHAFTRSTLVRKLNNVDYRGAAKEFDRWVHANSKLLPGLVARRKAERKLFERDLGDDDGEQTPVPPKAGKAGRQGQR